MIIRKIAFGDSNEAFIEERLSPGFNIIYSDDNNKGKTIVMQSALYAIGNEPIFPSSFEYKNYYHYVEFELDNKRIVSSCRKGDSFIVKTDNGITILDSVSELKRFLNRNGFVFPSIIKNNATKIVDPVLLFQLFFVGQDKKDSSNIFSPGYYNKEDFWNLIFAIKNIDYHNTENINSNEIKKRITTLEEERKVLLEKHRILKKSSPVIELISQKQGNEAFETKVKKIEEIRDLIVGLKKRQNRALQRKTINEKTLSEIKSLNKTPSSGDLYCIDCGSKRIGYSSGDKSYSFDISDTVMRRNIREAIEEKINAYQEEIEDCTSQINQLQKQLQEHLKEEEINLESILLYKNDIADAAKADTRVTEINKDINSLKSQLQERKNYSQDNILKQEALKKAIIDEMNSFYRQIDSAGTLEFDNLFSKRSSVYSGCEATEFYLSKLYALAVTLSHKYPIMMDYFRDGELSTEKELSVIQKFEKLTNQIIFTATLKEQELGKYASNKNINAIDYSSNKASHILSPEHVSALKILLTPLMIKM